MICEAFNHCFLHPPPNTHVNSTEIPNAVFRCFGERMLTVERSFEAVLIGGIFQ